LGDTASFDDSGIASELLEMVSDDSLEGVVSTSEELLGAASSELLGRGVISPGLSGVASGALLESLSHPAQNNAATHKASLRLHFLIDILFSFSHNIPLKRKICKRINPKLWTNCK
jgi:hypothetical protein